VNQRAGLAYGMAAYIAWGSSPILFYFLAEISPFEIVPWRVATTLVFCAIGVTLMRSWTRTIAILRSPKLFGWFILSSALLYLNWQFYVIGIVTERIIETALGYFINPLITILIGVVVRKERLSRLQWIAVGIAGVGMLVSAIAYGRFPFIALGLAITFGLYGAVRKHSGDHVDALTGLNIETIVGMIFAVPQLIIVFLIGGHLGAFDHGPVVTTLLMLSGVATAIPLLLFGAAMRRLPLSQMGFLQFTTPILGFLVGYFIFHEPMPASRWIGFCAVWLALIVLLCDMVITMRRARLLGSDPAPPTGEIVLPHSV